MRVEAESAVEFSGDEFVWLSYRGCKLVSSSADDKSLMTSHGAWVGELSELGSRAALERWAASKPAWLELAKRAVDMLEDAGYDQAYVIRKDSVSVPLDRGTQRFSLSVRGLRELLAELELE